jgi:hypothetical protein
MPEGLREQLPKYTETSQESKLASIHKQYQR